MLDSRRDIRVPHCCFSTAVSGSLGQFGESRRQIRIAGKDRMTQPLLQRSPLGPTGVDAALSIVSRESVDPPIVESYPKLVTKGFDDLVGLRDKGVKINDVDPRWLLAPDTMDAQNGRSVSIDGFLFGLLPTRFMRLPHEGHARSR